MTIIGNSLFAVKEKYAAIIVTKLINIYSAQQVFLKKYLEWERGLRFIINRLETNFIIKMTQIETLRKVIWQKKIEELFFVLNSKYASRS